METLPKNMFLRIGSYYTMILIPLMFLSNIIVSMSKGPSIPMSGPQLLGQFTAWGLLFYLLWIAIRTYKLYSGNYLREQFKPISKLISILNYTVLIILVVLWIFMIFEFGKFGFDGFVIFISIFFGILVFYLLGVVFYIKDNKLLQKK